MDTTMNADDEIYLENLGNEVAGNLAEAANDFHKVLKKIHEFCAEQLARIESNKSTYLGVYDCLFDPDLVGTEDGVPAVADVLTELAGMARTAAFQYVLLHSMRSRAKQTRGAGVVTQ